VIARRWAAMGAAFALVSGLPLATACASHPQEANADRGARIVGFNGITYDSAPLVVTGRNGDLFLGLDFDIACSEGGAGFTTGMRRIARLAKVIEASGRRAIFTVAPNKEMVNRQNVDLSALPQGSCNAASMKDQARVLDTFPDRRYLPIRKTLAQDHRQVYWKTDTHWTTLGASDWTLKLAGHLDPKLTARQKYSVGSQTYLGYLNRMLGVTSPETVPAALPAGAVKVKTSPKSLYPFKDPNGGLAVDYEWNSKPAHRTWPGHTLLMGDSFTLMGLLDLRPLFEHGHYQWIGNVSTQAMADAIAKSDTVVIELLQLFLTSTPIAQKSFRDLVKKTLRRADRS
jgi:hypothetical protein